MTLRCDVYILGIVLYFVHFFGTSISHPVVYDITKSEASKMPYTLLERYI